MNFKRDIAIFFKYLNYLKIHINRNEFKHQVESHPDYPSLLSFSDALSFFSIYNMAIRASHNDLNSLPHAFLTMLSTTSKREKQHLSFIRRCKEKYYYTREDGKEREISFENLQIRWTEIVLLIEDHNEKKRVSVGNFSLSFLLLVMIVLLLVLLGNVYVAILTSTVLFGIYLSVEAIKIELGLESSVSNQFCSITTNSDCGKIINSPRGSIASFKLSDLSIWFFSSQFFCICIFSVVNLYPFLSILQIVLIGTIPITCYSIYFQFKIENRWCPICLGVISVIYLELLFLLMYSKAFFSIDNIVIMDILLVILVVSITALGYYFIKRVLKKYADIVEENTSNLRYIKNYNFFKNALLSNKIKPNFTYDGLHMGNTNANIVVTIIYSPFCSYCKDVHQTLYSIYSIYKDSVCFKIRFNLSGHDELSQEVYIQMHRIYNEEGEIHFLKAVDSFYRTKNTKQWLKKYKTDVLNRTKIINDIITDNWENVTNGILFTPYILINDYVYPKQLKKSYIGNFLADLVEDDYFKEKGEGFLLS